MLLLVCVDKAAVAHRELGRCSSFAVNVLAADQKDVSSLFARQGEPEAGRLRGDTPWNAGQTGAPLIQGAVAHLECLLHQAVEAGDHTIFLGRVVAAAVARGDAEPLLYYGGSYRFLAGA
jgi:flavin reductase (DIM6/NTAB) family NADH-FMN oxidoreductase RutF